MYKIFQKKRWLPWGYTTVFEGTYDLSSAQFSKIIDQGLTVLKRDFFNASEHTNLKGQDSGESGLLPKAPSASGEEILALTGEIAIDSQAKDFKWVPFGLSACSNFNRFEGVSDIIHTHALSKTPSLPDWLPWELLGTGAPIKPHFFRIGIDHYTSTFTLLQLGFIPTVTHSLRIEANESSLICRVTFESRRKLNSAPLSKIPIFSALVSAIGSIDGLPLLSDIGSDI